MQSLKVSLIKLTTMEKTKTFDEAWAELEQLVEDIEDETIPLEELAEKVKKARALISYCEKRLRQIEKDLNPDVQEE